jgi:hypothetical protein
MYLEPGDTYTLVWVWDFAGIGFVERVYNMYGCDHILVRKDLEARYQRKLARTLPFQFSLQTGI